MRLKLLAPTEVLVDEDVTKIIAEADNGHFCLLPRHIDFLASLVPGILSYTDPTGQEQFVAIDEGLLVKQDQEVLVSTRQAIPGSDLGQLRETVKDEFETLDERQRVCHSAIASLEANFLRRFLELGEHRL